MNWYKGEIPAGVALAQEKCGVFVVYIEGNDEESSRFTKIIDEENVSELLQSEKFVAVKVVAGTETHKMFEQIFKATPVPSIYFVGKDGIILDIITAITCNEELIRKLYEISIETTVPNPNVQIGQDPLKLNADNTELVVSTSDQSSTLPLTQDEKVARIQQLLEKKRDEKKQLDVELEREREVERRNFGRNQQEFKRRQEKTNAQQILAEHQRERRADQEARQQVLAQIEQDKRDRAARFMARNKVIGLADFTANPPLRPSLEVHPPVPPDFSRLQFRLSNGDTHLRDFRAMDTLQTVYAYLKDDLHLDYQFTLGTMFPRQEFNDRHMGETLFALKLFPTAVVLVLPTENRRSGGGIIAKRDAILDFLRWVLVPVFGAVNMVRALIFGGDGVAVPAAPAAATSSKLGGIGRRSDKGGPSGVNIPQKRLAKTHVIRKQGNIHGLADAEEDSDDENNTWNGNSTQQM